LTTEDKQEFADLMGYRRDGDNYYDKTTGQKIDNITIDAIQTALASARADTKAVVKMAELSRATAEDS
jgi:hypothetical protein